MKIAAIQHDIVWEDAPATFARLEPTVSAAAASGARLVVLTEMFATGFSVEPERVAEPEGGPTSTWLAAQAERHDLWLAGSVPEVPPDATRPRNVLVLCGPKGEVHRYAKIHPFSYAGEHERYEAGTDHVTVEVEGVRVSLFVCYDLRFADEFWALAADTDLYVVVANWPEVRRHHWRSLLMARAIENQAYVVGVNRVGSGGGLEYAGDSMVIDPLGELLASAAKEPALLVTEVDAAHVAAVRARFPFIGDRR
ncbi:MAG TPA: nitrilase-related carbon-nitrogen hydrolase [Microthrixaceae bacterium]|nr:nitrilase-related carbon-nitrogen hydrolase [Microthrixaceae bacterium]